MGGPSTMLILGLLTLILTLIQAQTPLRIAWMGTGAFVYYFNASTSLGALTYALDEIANSPTLLPGYSFDVRWKDSDCNSRAAIGAAFEYFEDPSFTPDLLLGPICSGAMAPVAQLAAYKNLPVFGWISSDPLLQDKSVYPTLVRLLWPIVNIGEGVVVFLRQFDWHRAFIISSVGGDYGELGKGLRDVIEERQDEGFQVARWERDVEIGADAATIKAIYNKVKEEARVVILCVPLDELRNWALAAYEADMHEGEYAFIYTNQVTADEKLVAQITGEDFINTGDGNEENVRTAFESFFMMFAKTLAFETTQKFLADFHAAALASPIPASLGLPVAKPDFYSLFLYDALKVYARFATAANTVNDGRRIFAAAKQSVTEKGATGDIILSATCDRIPDYWIFDLQKTGLFGTAATTRTYMNGTTVQRELTQEAEFRWPDGTEGVANAPKDVPDCGFRNEKCPNLVLYIVPAVVAAVLIVIVIAIIFIYRKLKYERDLNDLVWKLNWEEMTIYTGANKPGSMMNLRTSRVSVADSLAGEQLFITVANYRGAMVAVKRVRQSKVVFERQLLQEMRTMVEVKHHNLNSLIGACVEAPDVCLVWEYCTKGSLQDVIWNEAITLDDMFKFSIIIDILKGLEFLHASTIGHHGRLKSTNIVIDGRWACKLTDYGARHFTEGQEEDEEMSDHAKLTGLFWSAPETLQPYADDVTAVPPSLRGVTSACDVYAAGVILKETFCRNGPYTECEDELEPTEILQRVVTPAPGRPPFRPALTELAGGVEAGEVVAPLSELLTKCWAEEPQDRPTAHSLLKSVTKVNPFKSANVMDNMMAMMERYNAQLEEIVAERTLQLGEEKKKTEQLLYKMLPRSVAEDLKLGRTVDAVSFDQVTLYFSDITGFTELAAASTPFQVVDILNGVYSLMDSTIERHDVYKVETVGDVYVLASGLPVRNGDRHVVEVTNCALDILSGMISFQTPHKPSHKLRVRIGIHTGTIVTGVVGLTSPRYCLFGDTINTTSRMESHGLPMRIHISPKGYLALKEFGGYRLADRGMITVKGKGDMNTYWVMGCDTFKGPLPNFEKEFSTDSPVPKILPITTGKTTAPRVPRPSTESGFDELEGVSRKTSVLTVESCEGELTDGAQRRLANTPSAPSGSHVTTLNQSEHKDTGLPPVNIHNDPS